MDRLHRHRNEDLTGGRAGDRVRRGGGDGGGGAMEAGRRGRLSYHDGRPGGAVPLVDQADCTAQTCRSCVAVTLADAIALGCCPCAVVSLLGLAFVKAPLALARRCLRRLRRRRGELQHKKRVRDMDGAAVAKPKCSSRRRRSDAGHGAVALEAHSALSKDQAWGSEAGARGGEAAATRAARAGSSASSGRLDAEKVWMEMYRVGNWGFGRLSISSMTPPPPLPVTVRPGCRSPDGGRKDVDLQCES